MNRKLYEAVPLKEWKKNNPDQDWNLMPHSWTSDGDLCVLVPVEEVDKWISPEKSNYGPYAALGFHKWMVQKGWQRHSSGEYYFTISRAGQWPPDQTATEEELLEMYFGSPSAPKQDKQK